MLQNPIFKMLLFNFKKTIRRERCIWQCFNSNRKEMCMDFLNELTIKKESIVTKSYYIGVFFLVFRFILANTYLESEWMSVFTFVGVFFEVMRILCVRRGKKYLCFLTGALAISVLAYEHTQSLTVLYFFIIVFASYRVDYERFVKLLFWTIAIAVVIVFVISAVGLIPIVNASGYITFGFLGKNGLSIYLCTLLVIYMFMNYEKKSTNMNICVFLSAIIISIWLQARTSVYTTFAILFIMIVSKRMSKSFNRKMLYVIFLVTVATVCFLTYRVIHFGDNAFDWVINKMLTGRLLQANYYYKWYGFTSFGSVLKEYADKSHYFLDFGYMNMIIQNGYVYFAINIMVYVFSMLKLIKENNVKTSLLVLYVLIMLIGETAFCNPFFNPVYPVFSYYLLSRNFKISILRKKENHL